MVDMDIFVIVFPYEEAITWSHVAPQLVDDEARPGAIKIHSIDLFNKLRTMNGKFFQHGFTTARTILLRSINCSGIQ